MIGTRMLRDRIREGLLTSFVGQDVVFREKVDSTNTLANRLAEAGAADGTLVIADLQTAGRGRRGKSFYSPPGCSIYMSFILKPGKPLKDASSFTLVTAVAVAKGLERVTSLRPQIKWPNDLLLNGRKICGILIETRFEKQRVEYYVAGIGINVNNRISDFPEDLQDRVTSLAEETGHTWCREELIQAIAEELEVLYLQFIYEGFRNVRPLWLSYCNLIGKSIEAKMNGVIVQGTLIDLLEDGSLLLRTEEGEEIQITSAEALT